MKRILSFLVVATALTLVIQSCKKKSTTTTTPPVAFMASTTPSNRVAVLEDFTGVRCGYCTDGHDRAKAILDANPGKFIIIATNAGSYAAPSNGWADFTTVQGNAINAQAKPAGYPAGTMNRMPCATLGVNPMNAGLSTITMDRGQWAKAAAAVMATPAPVNIGASATFDNASRKLTVKVDLYYTAAETGNNINVGLLQSKLLATQSNYTPGQPNPTPNYEENHVLRDMITSGNFGEPITETQAVGTKISKTYTYTVPNDYHGTTVNGGGAVVIANCSVVVYVSRGTLDILNAVEIPIK